MQYFYEPFPGSEIHCEMIASLGFLSALLFYLVLSFPLHTSHRRVPIHTLTAIIIINVISFGFLLFNEV